MSKSVFVVMENDFEYNDEYYYHTGGGAPVKAFLDRESAQEHADALLASFVADADEHELSCYFDGAGRDDFGWKRCKEAARGGPEERLAFAKEICLEIYHVVEVVVEMNALEDSTDFEFEQ